MRPTPGQGSRSWPAGWTRRPRLSGNGVKNAATGDPTTRSVTDSNARYVMDADAGYFKASSQNDALPTDPSQRAQRLTELANIARATAEKWNNATISATFTDNEAR